MKSYDLVIVGCGIVGSAAAFYASRRNKKVLIIEKNFCGFNSSGNAQGGLAPYIYDNKEMMKFHTEAMSLHAELRNELQNFSSTDPSYVKKPYLRVAVNEDEANNFKEFLSISPEEDCFWYSENEIKKAESKLINAMYGGIFSENYFEVDSFNLTNSLKDAAINMGSKLINFDFRQENLITHNVNERIRFEGVSLDKEKIHAENIIISSGPWTKGMLDNLMTVNVMPLKGQILRASSKEELNISVSWGKDYATKKQDGLLWLGTTEEDVGFDDSPTSDGKKMILDAFKSMFSGFSDLHIERQTACLRPSSPENVPIIRESESIKGLYVSTGAGRSGIKLGPALGKRVVDLINTN